MCPFAHGCVSWIKTMNRNTIIQAFAVQNVDLQAFLARRILKKNQVRSALLNFLSIFLGQDKLFITHNRMRHSNSCSLG